MHKLKSFDVIGTIALLNIPKVKKEEKEEIKNWAKDLLETHKNIKGVFIKSKITGRLRTPKLNWIIGNKKTETIHNESGCRFKINIKTCYFSPRLGTDRLEIAKKVKRNEKVLVMFSGIAPYGIIIAKHSKAKQIVCVELGKECSKYALENVKLNKLNNIEIIQGNVNKVLPKLKIKFDRILMPRAQLKEDFLKEAFLVVKKGTIIHFYDFIESRDLDEMKLKLANRISEKAKHLRKKIKILDIKKVREIAPYKYHARIDFKII